MEQTPAARFVDVLGRLGYKTQQQIADLLQIARPTAGTIVRQEREPSFSDVGRLKEKHDEVNIDYIFTGQGQPLSRNLLPVAPAQVLPTQPGSGESTLRINRAGELEGSLLVAELRSRLADKDRELERVYDQLAAWQEAYRKPLASAEAAASYALPSPCNPIGPRFDGPARMWIAREVA